MTDRIPMRDVRGFNYAGSWGTSALDLWQHHDNGLMAVEVARGKRYFPAWNVARWWLSHEAFQRSPERFLANFEAGLAIFAGHGIQVLPVLFNRWRDPICDFGGVALDHIVPGLGLVCGDQSFRVARLPGAEDTTSAHDIQALFARYLEAVVGTHATDERIFGWDLCNEPLMAPYVTDPESSVRAAELRWLGWCRDMCTACGARQPITIGNHANVTAIELTEPLVDFISFHPYYIPKAVNDDDAPAALGAHLFAHANAKPTFEAYLDEVTELARRSGKELLASETVWGAIEDGEREALIRYTLGEVGKRGIGFMVYALHHSLIADLHRSEYGPVGSPGNLAFINADGALRAGHEAFNEFAAAD
jgi:hypothetical protein